MPLDTYANLQASIVSWAMRSGDTEFAAQVPDFITLAETRLNRALRVGAMETVTTLTPADDGTVSLPADYLEFRAVAPVAGFHPALRLVAPDYEVGRFSGNTVPQAFTVTGSTLTIFPAGTVILRYFAKIPPLSIANPANWLLAAAPDLYLYGSLLEAAPYMEEDARAQVWKTFYDAALSDLTGADKAARYARAAVRTRGPNP